MKSAKFTKGTGKAVKGSTNGKGAEESPGSAEEITPLKDVVGNAAQHLAEDKDTSGQFSVYVADTLLVAGVISFPKPCMTTLPWPEDLGKGKAQQWSQMTNSSSPSSHREAIAKK